MALYKSVYYYYYYYKYMEKQMYHFFSEHGVDITYTLSSNVDEVKTFRQSRQNCSITKLENMQVGECLRWNARMH